MLSQSGVVPYRYTSSGLEVLLITSTNTGRWQFPKGMLEPGMSAVESAEMEGLEEAGAWGRADPEPLLAYRYHKQGLWPVEVTLYPMAVIRFLSEEEWEESGHRQRQWVDADEARRRLVGTPLEGAMSALEERLIAVVIN